MNTADKHNKSNVCDFLRHWAKIKNKTFCIYEVLSFHWLSYLAETLQKNKKTRIREKLCFLVTHVSNATLC